MALTIAVALAALIVGFAIGHVTAVIAANETLTKSSRFYRELVARGDASMAMLKMVGDQLEHVLSGKGPTGSGKRIITPDEISSIKQKIDLGHRTTVNPNGG